MHVKATNVIRADDKGKIYADVSFEVIPDSTADKCMLDDTYKNLGLRSERVRLGAPDGYRFDILALSQFSDWSYLNLYLAKWDEVGRRMETSDSDYATADLLTAIHQECAKGLMNGGVLPFELYLSFSQGNTWIVYVFDVHGKMTQHDICSPGYLDVKPGGKVNVSYPEWIVDRSLLD